MERPSTVPRGASFNPVDETWGIGEKRGELHVGTWTWWRTNGLIASRSSFDDSGRLHGPFIRFHPDGTPARVGRYRDGREEGPVVYARSLRPSDESFPAAADVWRAYLTYADGELQGSTYELRDGTPCNAHGVPKSIGYRDGRFVGREPDDFLRDNLRKFLGVDAEAPVHPGLRDFEAVWGEPAPEELTLWVQTAVRPDPVALFELRPVLSSPVLHDAADGPPNLFERLILADQRDSLGTALAEAFSGTTVIGSFGNGDTWHLGLVDTADSDLERGQIYYFNHETYDLEEPIARDLPSAVYLSALCTAVAYQESISPDGFRTAFESLRHRVSPTWHFNPMRERASIGEMDDFSYVARAQLARYFFYRALWLIHLLRNDAAVPPDAVGDFFIENVNPVLSDEQHARWLARAPRLVPTGLYCLFRSFFFDKPAHLEDYIRVCRESGSRLLRDAAELVEQLKSGRKALGAIEDIHHLREQFQALDLDPDRAEERLEEQRREQLKLAEARAESRERVVQAAETGDGLDGMAWDDLEDADLHTFVVEQWLDDPTMQATLDTIRWLDDQGWVRANLVMEHERQEAILYLGEHGDRRIVPILVGRMLRGDYSPPAEILAAMRDPRTIEPLMGLLAVEDKYHRARMAAIRALVPLAPPGLVEELSQLLATVRLDGRSSDAIRNEELVTMVIDALGWLADPRGIEALMGIVHEASNRYDDVRENAAIALAELDHTPALDLLLDLLERDEDDTPQAVLRAIARLAPQTESFARERARALLEACPTPDDLGRRALIASALAQLDGKGEDLDPLVRRALTEPRYDRQETIEQRILALEIVGAHPELDVDLAAEQVRTDHHGLRQAAIEALLHHEQEVPRLSLWWRRRVFETYAAEGPQPLFDALEDPDALLLYNVVLKLASTRDAGCAEAIGGFVRRRLRGHAPLATGGELPHDLYWAIRTLCELNEPAGNDVLEEVLFHRDNQVRWPAMKGPPPPDPNLIPAMVNVIDHGMPWMQTVARRWLEKYRDTEAYREAMAKRK